MMQILDSFSQNSIIAVPWMLDAEAEDLDLEIHGCGCGCGSCGCACTCSCSCSCSCDDTGAHEDDNDYSGDFSASDDSGDEGAGPSAADIGQCATDIAASALFEGTVATGIAAVVSKIPGGAAVAPAIMAAGTLHGAVDGARDSEACTQVVEDTGAAIAQMAQDAGAAIVEAYNQLTNDENFQKAAETVQVVH